MSAAPPGRRWWLLQAPAAGTVLPGLGGCWQLSGWGGGGGGRETERGGVIRGEVMGGNRDLNAVPMKHYLKSSICSDSVICT